MSSLISRHLDSRATNPTTLMTAQNVVIAVVIGSVALFTGEPAALLGLAFLSPAPVLSADHYAIAAGIADQQPPDNEDDTRPIGFTAHI